MSLYIDEDLYIPLTIEAQRRRKDLYRFVKDILKEACQNTRESQPAQSGWVLVDSSPTKRLLP